jgi:hypothetical protein
MALCGFALFGWTEWFRRKIWGCRSADKISENIAPMIDSRCWLCARPNMLGDGGQ